jgi:polyisoprenyl-phosphate glycosyltransferase
MKNTISVVIPVYYNEDSLPKLFEELGRVENELSKKKICLELIFVDDGSGDNSLDILLAFKNTRPETIVIKLTRNFGAIKAVKAGLKFVTGDAFSVLAADLQDPPNLILEMIDRWLSGSKFVLCARRTRDDPLMKKILAKLYYKIIRSIVIKNYPDGGYDLSLMDKTFLPHLLNSSKSVFLPLLAYWLGYKPDTIYYHRRARKNGKSRWTFSKNLATFLDVMLGFSVTPIRLISGIGLIVALASFLLGANVVISSFFFEMPVQGYVTIVALITFLLGLIIVMLGLIGEYLWRIFNEIDKKPDSVIEEIW